jgi:hypothetical protein
VSALLDPLMVTRESLSPVPLTPAASPSLETVLRERFGLQEFRPWQREAIDAVLGDPHDRRGLSPDHRCFLRVRRLERSVLGARLRLLDWFWGDQRWRTHELQRGGWRLDDRNQLEQRAMRVYVSSTPPGARRRAVQ